eukprot:29587-Pelagococcus_subviridis.AAC.8
MLHLGAVRRPAVRVLTPRRVHEQLHRALDLLRAHASVLLRHPRPAVASPAASHERVFVALHALAVVTDVKVRARLASPPLAGLELALTAVARRHERGLGRVVEVIQHHHRRVLGASKRVELEVVPLAQREERLSRVEKLRVDHLVALLDVRQRVHAFAHEIPPRRELLLVRLQRLLHVVALLAQLKGGARRRRRGVVPPVVVRDALPTLRALVREVDHDEVVTHRVDRRPELLHELDVELSLGGADAQAFALARLPRRRRRLLSALALVLLRELGLFLLDARDPVLRDAGEVIAVEIRQLRRGRDVVVLVPEVKLVV